MIEPGNSLGDRCNGWAIRQWRSLEHEYGDTERSGRGYLAVRSLATAVLRDDRIDGKRFQQLAVSGLGKRPTREDVVRMRHFQRRIHRINTSNEVMMLWGAVEWNQLLPSDCEEHAPRAAAQCTHSALRARNLHPEITGCGRPRGSAQAEDGRRGLRGSHRRIGGNRFSIRMRSVDQEVDAVGTQVFCEACGAPKPADPHGHSLSGRCYGPAGQGYRRVKLATAQRGGQLASLRSTPQDQDVRAHVQQP
jgi:hypothetical protein